MAKINRYTGDLKAFASNSTGTNRTVFGDVTQSDTLDDNINTDYFLGWEIVGVNDKPKKQHFNALGYTMGQLLSYLHQMGVPEWDLLQEFPATAIANKNGAFYISQQIHTGQDPELDTTNTYWSNPLSMSEFFTDSGVADAYVFAPADGKPRPIAYTDGLKVSAVISNPCTGGAVTAEITGIAGGAKSVKLSGGADPAAGDITGRTKAVYDAANGWFELIKDTGYDNLLHIQDQKPSGTAGGGNTNGVWVTRTLNTVLTNQIVGASLSSNQITLPAGQYYLESEHMAYQIQGNKVRLRNITDSSDILIGLSYASGSSSAVSSSSSVAGAFTLASTKTLELQHNSSNTDANGFGLAALMGVVEVYSDTRIWELV